MLALVADFSLISEQHGKRSNDKIEDCQYHKEHYISIEEYINYVKPKMQKHRVNQIVVSFKKNVHQNGD